MPIEEYGVDQEIKDYVVVDGDDSFAKGRYSATTKEELLSMLKEGIYDLLLQYNEELAETFDDLKNPTLENVADVLYIAGANEINIG